jgi:hypothetical protein
MMTKKRKILSPVKVGQISSKVAKLAVRKVAADRNTPYRAEQELFDKILSVIYEHEGMMSTVAVLGVLELVKDDVKDI